jgi:hypothetical protein
MSSSVDRQPQVASNLAESATSEAGSVQEPAHVEKLSRDAFAKVRGELTEEEFASPVVSRMLLDRISDLRSQLQEEKPFRARFHQADKERAVLEEKFKTRISSEVMFGVCLSAGSVLISVAPTLPATSHFPTILLWTGIILFLGAVISRIIILKKK